MSLENERWLGSAQVPAHERGLVQTDARRLIVATRQGQVFAIGAEGSLVDKTGVGGDHLRLPGLAQLPRPGRAIATAGEESPPVGTEPEAQNAVVVAVELGKPCPAGEIDQPRRPWPRTPGQRPPVRAESKRADVAGIGRVGPDRGPSSCRSQTWIAPGCVPTARKRLSGLNARTRASTSRVNRCNSLSVAASRRMTTPSRPPEA